MFERSQGASMEKSTVFSTNCTRKIEHSYVKKKKIWIHISYHIHKLSQWKHRPKLKPKSIKLRQENTGEKSL